MNRTGKYNRNKVRRLEASTRKIGRRLALARQFRSARFEFPESPSSRPGDTSATNGIRVNYSTRNSQATLALKFRR